MTAFTPGPWAVFRDAYGGGLYIDTALGIDSSNGMVVAGQIHGKQRDANGRLIAAAPDMFNVLTLLLATEPDDADGMADVHADAKAALAKAGGEQTNEFPTERTGAANNRSGETQ